MSIGLADRIRWLAVLTVILAPGSAPAGELHEAVLDGDSSRIATLLEDRPDLSDHGPDGLTALHLAAREGELEIVEQLLAAGADPNAEHRRHLTTPLHLAALNQHHEVAERLLSAGANIDALASIQAVNPTQWPPLMHAVLARTSGQLDFRSGPTTPGRSIHPLAPGLIAIDRAEEAPFSDRLAMAELLLEKGADVSAGGCGESAVLLAVVQGELELVTLLLSHGADVNSRTLMGARLLDLATALDENAIADLLEELGAHRQAEIAGVDTALHRAAAEDDEEDTAELLAEGAAVDARNRWEETPLMKAAEEGNEDVAALLIAAGADVDAEWLSCGRAVHRAIQAGSDDVVRLLASAGADLDARDGTGATPLHLAIRLDEEDLANLLVSLGASLDVENHQGQTVREFAAAAGKDFEHLSKTGI